MLNSLIAFERDKNSAIPISRPSRFPPVARDRARGAEGGALPEGRVNVGGCGGGLSDDRASVGGRTGWAALAAGCADAAGGGGGRVALPKVTPDKSSRG